MLISNYNLGPVGFGNSLSPLPSVFEDAFFVSRTLSSDEHEVADKLRIAIKPSVRIDFFMSSNFSNDVIFNYLIHR